MSQACRGHLSAVQFKFGLLKFDLRAVQLRLVVESLCHRRGLDFSRTTTWRRPLPLRLLPPPEVANQTQCNENPQSDTQSDAYLGSFAQRPVVVRRR
jgi:hypothetical protein